MKKFTDTLKFALLSLSLFLISCLPLVSYKKPVCNTENRIDFINLEGSYYYHMNLNEESKNHLYTFFFLRESKGLYKIISPHTLTDLSASGCLYNGYPYLEVLFDKTYILHRLTQSPKGDLTLLHFFAYKNLLTTNKIPYTEPDLNDWKEFALGELPLDFLLKIVYGLNIDNRKIGVEKFFQIIDPSSWQIVLYKED